MADWKTPKTDWTPADGIGSTDLNRIESNAAHLFDKAAHGKKKFTQSGTFVVPPTVTEVYVTMAGAGGGGAGGYTNTSPDDPDEYEWGGDGGMGQIIWCRTVPTIPGENVAVTVGKGGAGGNEKGGDGGSSSFGSYLVAAGGKGGTRSSSGAYGGGREVQISYGYGGSSAAGWYGVGGNGTAGVVLIEW